MERIVHKGRVSELTANGKPYLALDMPRNLEEATMSFALEATFSINDIFMPYLGKNITITIEKEKGKIQKIKITEDK